MRKFIFQSPRIGFSTWASSDLHLAKSLWGDTNVTKYITASGIFNDQEIQQRLDLEINNLNTYKVQYWPIFTLEEEQFIGCCGLLPYDLANNIYEIGIHLCYNAWGKGYAFEGSKAVIEYAFSVLKIANIFAGHHPDNNASSKLLVQLGFHFFENVYYAPPGLNHPSYLYK